MTRRISSGYGFASGGLGQIQVVQNTLSTSAGDITLSPTSGGILDSKDVVKVNNATNATSASTGAIRVSGPLTVSGSVNVGGYITTTAWNNGPIGSVTPAAARFTSVTATNLTTLSESAEVSLPLTGATGSVTHDYTVANTFVHSSIGANFTANFTNVPVTANRTYTFTLIFNQGAIPYYASSIAINGSVQTVNWQGGQFKANNVDIQMISLIRANGVWTVISTVQNHSLLLDGSSSSRAAPDANYLFNAGITTSNAYWINLPQLGPTQVYCDMTTDGGRWMMMGYLGSIVGVGNVNQAVFSTFGTLAATRASNQSSFSRFDIAKAYSGTDGGNTQLMWRRTSNSNIIVIHTLDALFDRMATNPDASSVLLNFQNNPNGQGIGFPIKKFKMSNTGPANLKLNGGARYENGPTYPGIAWNGPYNEDLDNSGSYTSYLNPRSILQWETGGVENNTQWFRGGPLTLTASTGNFGNQAMRDVEIYFRYNPLGNQ